MINRLLRLLIVASLLTVPAAAYADSKSAEMMRKVLDRDDGDTRISVLSMVTCSYKVVNDKLKCNSRPRKKKMQQVVKDYGANGKDARGFTLILEPAAENGIGILQYDYEQRGKDADQWLYLPEIGKVKRVASGSDAPKKGSLFGSEFSLEDIEAIKVEDYQFSLIEEKTWKKRPVMVIEQVPTQARAKKTNYSKQIQWVDTERLLLLKTEYYGWNGKLMKVSFSKNVEKISAIWTVKKQVMRNIETQRISVMEITDVRYNRAVSDEMLTKRILSDKMFREVSLRSVQTDS